MKPAATFPYHDDRRVQFIDEPYSPWPREEKPVASQPTQHSHTHSTPDCNHDCCPYCQQPIPAPPSSLLQVLYGGVHGFVMAIITMIAAFVRLIRLIVASALCLVGLVGAAIRAVGIRVAHPNDRRFFRSRMNSLPPHLRN